MNTPLVEALKELNLAPGESRHVSVNGYLVELRRVEEEEESEFANMVMLRPWVEFPDPPPAGTVIARRGPLPLPDPPVIPLEDEELG